MPRRTRRSNRATTVAQTSQYWGSEVDETYFLGYCEDQETPEAIMKKFEALERMQNQKKKEAEATMPKRSGKCEADPALEAAQVALSEADMKKLFKETSQFTVDSAVRGNDMLYDNHIVYEEGF